MATALDPALTKKTFQNWLKGALAVLFTREGLTEFVKAEISDFQRDLLQSIFTKNGIPLGTTCRSCTTANMLRCPTQDFCDKRGKCKIHDSNMPNKNPNQKCPQNICHNVKDAIHKHHRFQGPTWQITDATKWCSDAFQIAKCYLPPKGYDNKTSFDEIDFNGTLGVIINNTRFQNQMTAQINSCSKVRDMINENIRHSSSYELSDIDLARCIDALRDLLQDSKFLLHDQHAQDAVNKLNELQNNTLVITVGDITKVLDEDISERISKQKQEAIQCILDHLAKVQEASVASLGDIIEAKDKAIEAIQKEAKQQIKAVKQVGAVTMITDDVLFKDLKEDIITYYREHESVIPASPLVDEHNVPIEKLYVLPPMWAYKNSYFGPSQNRQKGDGQSVIDGQEKREVTISQLFVSGNVRYKKIYITANAGFGKTSLSQKLTMTWCQSHSPLESLAENYEGAKLTSEEVELDFTEAELYSLRHCNIWFHSHLPLTSLTEKHDDKDLPAMKYFDLLFLLHLRDYQSEPKCNLDDLIMQMVSEKLSRSAEYTNEFVQRILHNSKCLIILDGLDEWTHPGHCTRKPEVPHNNHPESCTVLTTTRDWKMGTIGLSPKDIDRRVEISMLDAKSRNLLEKNAIGILNERNLNLAGTTVEDFDKEVKKVQIGDIIYIPYILLQLMCLFFGGLPIGKSKCEIYSNITEFILKRGLNKRKRGLMLPDIHVQSNDNDAVPNCMKKKKKCNLYFNLIMKLGKLAFCALFSEKKESSLVFDRKYAKQFMTKQEIQFCLKVGLLCQTKDSSIIAEKQYQVFFHHKSVQEFFSAIYLTSEWQNKSVKSTILKFCSSVSSTLEMENVFVFVCGINPEVYTCISGELQKISDLDDVTRRYMSFVNDGDMKKVRSYQLMQMQCLQESMRNGNESCPIYLYVVIDTRRYQYRNEDLTTFQTSIHFNKGHVKSLILDLDDDERAAFMQSLDPGMFTSLEKLRVEQCDKEPVWLADILTESARTLKCLTLSGHTHSLSDFSITALTGLACLQSLYISHVDITHCNHKCLNAYISQVTTLTELKLDTIGCSDHRGQYSDCDEILYLHRLNELNRLILSHAACRELHVNPACLEVLSLHPKVKMTTRASATLWQDLHAAPVLSSLTLSDISPCQEMIQTIPTLNQLHYLKLDLIDMGDVIPRFSPVMTQLEYVEIWKVRMSSAAWRELLLSVGQLPQNTTVKLWSITMIYQDWRELLLSVGRMQHPVTVKLSWCKGPSREEWQTIVNMIKTTPTLSLLQELRFNVPGSASLNLKNKPVL